MAKWYADGFSFFFFLSLQLQGGIKVYAIAALRLENYICKISDSVLYLEQIEPKELNFCFYCQM